MSKRVVSFFTQVTLLRTTRGDGAPDSSLFTSSSSSLKETHRLHTRESKLEWRSSVRCFCYYFYACKQRKREREKLIFLHLLVIKSQKQREKIS